MAVLFVAGCTATAHDSSASSSTSSTSSAAAPASDSSTAAPAPTTQATDEPCPYLDTEFVKDTIGQHLSKVTVTTVTPAPGPLPQCDFARPDGAIAATVSTTTVSGAAEAMNLALQFAPDGNPVSAGEGGSVLIKRGGNETVLAAYQGTALVYVTINQESSLEATEIATQVLTAI